MGVPPRGGDVMRSGLDDLVTFNRWLCMTRLRAAGAVVVFTLALAWLSSVPSGLAMATAATLGHEALLVHERGLSLATLASVESLVPTFLFFLLAQQCFFYGAHLKRKNTALASLAERLEESRQRLGAEARTSAALLDVARTLSSTLEAPEILARLNSTTSQQLGADWSGTFLVDPDFGTFRLVAATDADAAAGEPERLEFPVSGWAPVGRLAGEPVVVLTAAEAACTPGLGRSGRVLSTMILAALYHERVLAGFLAVGFGSLPAPEREQAVEFLSGIAQHATIVLRNARLLEEVRLASAMKSEFVGAISHELRSPLNVMLGYLEMTLDRAFGPITAEQRHALRRTQEQSLMLLEMITALLDMNRLEAGRLPSTVRDTGSGIPPEAIRYIFGMFRQVPGSGGVGLGLHLARRLLHVLGGTVRVASEVGKGTCFTVTLPLAARFALRQRRRPPAPLAPSADAA